MMNQVTLFRRIPKSGIFFEEPPSEVQSNHSSVHEDSNGSHLKSGILVDQPPAEDESNHSIQRVVSMPLMKTAQVPHIVGARPGVRQDGVHVSRLVQFAESTATPTEHVSAGSRNLLMQNSAALVQRKKQVFLVV